MAAVREPPPSPATLVARMLKNPFPPGLLKKVQMQGGERKAE